MQFEGTYYKHQCKDNVLCLIRGKADDGAFLQAILNERVYQYQDFEGCLFSDSGIVLDLPNLKGRIAYANRTPLKSDIMGFYRFFPMQCRHSVTSMYHDLSGSVVADGKQIDFDGGVGYIEGDKGRSFPKQYTWIQANDFDQKASIMVSVADIPFFGFHFLGCICAIIHNSKEYRLASYHGVKVTHLTKNRLVLVQKKLRLEVDVVGNDFVSLKMPINGKMIAQTQECNSANARFQFFENEKLLFDLHSKRTSFEYFF